MLAPALILGCVPVLGVWCLTFKQRRRRCAWLLAGGAAHVQPALQLPEMQLLGDASPALGAWGRGGRRASCRGQKGPEPMLVSCVQAGRVRVTKVRGCPA